MVDRAVGWRKAQRRRSGVGFAALAALAAMLIAIVGHAFASAAERREAEALQVHTLDVLLATEQLRGAVHAALRGERGYLITGDRNFLQPYFEGRARSIAAARELRAMTRDNAVQQRNLDAVDLRLSGYLDTLATLISLEQRGAHDEAVTIIRQGKSRTMIAGLLTAIDAIEVEERRLLGLRSGAAARADERAEHYVFAAAGAGGVLLALLTVAVVQTGRAHQRALDLGEQLHHLATTDALTGIANRRKLLEAMELEIARATRHGRPLSFALLDIDHFKQVNDRHGHPAGDAVLRAVAEELSATMRSGDIVGRFGGEEFAVVMPETNIEQAEFACERLRAAIARRVTGLPDGHHIRVTISTGVARLGGGETGDQIVSRADTALYAAKRDGRNAVRLAA